MASKTLKIYVSKIGNESITIKRIKLNENNSSYKPIKKILNDGGLETIELIGGDRKNRYCLIFDDCGKINNLPINETMKKMGIKMYGNVIITKANEEGEQIDIDLDLIEIKKMIVRTVDRLYPYLKP